MYVRLAWSSWRSRVERGGGGGAKPRDMRVLACNVALKTLLFSSVAYALYSMDILHVFFSDIVSPSNIIATDIYTSLRYTEKSESAQRESNPGCSTHWSRNDLYGEQIVGFVSI